MDILGNFSNLSGDKSSRLLSDKKELDFSYVDSKSTSLGRIEDKFTPHFSSAIKLFVALFFCVLIGRLFVLQVVNGSDNQKLAEGNRIRPRIVEASRGLITDNSGVWLARNKPDFALALYPSDLPKKSQEREAVYEKISALASVSVDDIKKAISEQTSSALNSVVVKDNIPHDDALLLEQKVAGVSGVFIASRSSREYAAILGLGHILGYAGLISPSDIKNNPDLSLSDKVGKVGLEKVYDNYLQGVPGIDQVEVDSKGNIVRVLVQDENRNPDPGNDVSLYLDRDLQSYTAAALQKGIDSAKQTLGENVGGGVAMVMDVHSGGMLSMVSLPDYDNNLFSGKISSSDYQKLLTDPGQPLFDKATQGTFPPGSISKIILASAGLAEGNITPATALTTPAAIHVGQYTFPDWKDHSYESTNVQRAIAESNDIFFYAVGGGYDKVQGLGIDKIKKWWQLFGLGEPTGIDLTGEASGLLPDSAWKMKAKNEPWYLGDTYHASIGQGDLLVTPLQMLRATAVIANGGTLLRPELVKKIVASDGQVVKEFGPNVERTNFIPPDIIQTVAQGMRQTVTGGSAQNLKDLSVSVAGKTGTAQFLDNQKTHAWFEAYAPYENPQIAVIVLVEGGGEGHDIAAPVAKDIINHYFTR